MQEQVEITYIWAHHIGNKEQFLFTYIHTCMFDYVTHDDRVLYLISIVHELFGNMPLSLETMDH